MIDSIEIKKRGDGGSGNGVAFERDWGLPLISITVECNGMGGRAGNEGELISLRGEKFAAFVAFLLLTVLELAA